MSFELLENSKVTEFDMDALLDGQFDFYGAHSGAFKLDDFVIIPLEDPHDGWRSYIDQYVLSLHPDEFIAPNIPFDKVYVQREKTPTFNGFKIRSIYDDHVWLYLGTDHTDDYYPFTVFTYCPRTDGQSKEQNIRTAYDYLE